MAKEATENKRSHDELRVLCDELLVANALSRSKLESFTALESEVRDLRIRAAESESIPALRAQIEELLMSNATSKSRVEMLEEERNEVKRLRGAEVQVLTLTDTASDLQRKLDETRTQLANERDNRIKYETLKESLHSQLAMVEVEMKSELKDMEQKCVLFL